MSDNSTLSPQWRGRLTFIVIVMLFALPLLAAWWLYLGTEKGWSWGTSNHGELLVPAQPLDAFALPAPDGSEFTLSDLQGKWTLIFIAPAVCDEVCKKNIYHMRQVRTSLGREMGRVQRLLILASEDQWRGLSDYLQHYPATKVLLDAGQETVLRNRSFTSNLKISESKIYLVDPLGNLMMAFPQSLDPKHMLKDLKKLLKISKIG